MPSLRQLAVLVLLIAGGASLKARTAEELVTAYFAGVRTGGMVAMTPLMHPEELAKFRQMFTPILTQAIKDPGARALFGGFLEPEDRTKLRPLSDAVFFNGFLQAFESIRPELLTLMKNSTVEVLGTVPEKDLVHVVIRLKMAYQGSNVDQATTVSTRLYNGEPMLILPSEIKGVVDAIRAQLP